MSQKMTFCIGYDGAFRADPELFHMFIALLRARGHEVVIVTSKTHKESAITREIVSQSAPIVYVGNYKWRETREAVKDGGYNVNVWILSKDDLFNVETS